MAKSNTKNKRQNADPDAIAEHAIAENAIDGAIEGESLEEAIAKLSPEQAEMFMRVLTLTMKKRRIMLFGNLLALFLMLAGMLWAFVAYGQREPGSFSAWVFLVPFASAGLSLWLFGRIASNAGAKTTTALEEGRQAQASKHA